MSAVEDKIDNQREVVGADVWADAPGHSAHLRGVQTVIEGNEKGHEVSRPGRLQPPAA